MQTLFSLIEKDSYKLYQYGDLAIIYYKQSPDPESIAFLDVSNASRINPKEGEKLLERLLRKSDSFLSEANKVEAIMKLVRRGAGEEEIEEAAKKEANEKARRALDNIVNVLGHNNILEQSHALLAFVVPMYVAMEMQDERFVSSQERSTRYVEFKELFIPERLKANSEALELYKDAAYSLLAAYERAFSDIKSRLAALYDKEHQTMPKEEYIATVIEPSARDLVRGMLPLGMQTVVFFSTNAKTLEHITRRLLSRRDNTCNAVGMGLKQVIEENMPSFSKHLEPNGFDRDYAGSIKKIHESGDDLRIMGFDEEKVYAKYATEERLLLKEIADMAGVEESNAQAYIKDISKNRRGRHDALNSTIFGIGSILFDIDISVGSLRDLNRHRDTIKNFEIYEDIYYLPRLFIEEKDYQYIIEALRKAGIARRKLREMGFEDEAKLLIPLATGSRLSMHMGFGEAVYIVENRSTKEAHPEYRGVALKMWSELKRLYPTLTSSMPIFVEEDAGESIYSRSERKGADDVNKVNKNILF